ncbi:MAG: AAA family ATPase [Clostridia bacterium]
MFNFSREKEIKEVKKNALISVWGTPSSGKTTVAINLAKIISEKKINVCLVMCDSTAPMLPCVFPPSEITEEKSLGDLLSKVNINQTTVKNNLTLLKHNPYLSVIGYLKGENDYSYSPYTRIQAEELIDSVKEVATVVIFDCTSSLSNVMSTTAIVNSDYMLNLANCDLKSISFLSSQISLLLEKGLDEDDMYMCLSNVKSFQSVELMKMSLGKIAFTLPHSQEVEEQFQSGNLLENLTFKNSKIFRKEIKKIINELIEI